MSRRIILGKSPSRASAPSGGYGLYVANTGFDADTAADANMVFSSDWPQILPVIAGGLGSIVVPVNTLTTVSFATQTAIPFGDFAWTPNSAPPSGGFTTGINAGHWYAYNASLYNYYGGLYIQTRLYINKFDVYLNNSTYQGVPSSIRLAYAIYAAAA